MIPIAIQKRVAPARWRPAGTLLVERAKRLTLSVLLRVYCHPLWALHASILKFKHDGDLPSIAERFGVRLETLQRQKESGLDNPAYRFHRDAAFFTYLCAHAEDFKGCSWLDVGADTGALSVYLSELFGSTRFELCDVHVAPRSSFPVRQIDGTHLDQERDAFDLVFFSYVLHHAADNTIPLLRDAHRIARKYVLVTEDPKETAEDCLWAYAHDRMATFRGRKEWFELFSALGYSVVYDSALDSQVHSRHFFLLAPDKHRKEA